MSKDKPNDEAVARQSDGNPPVPACLEVLKAADASAIQNKGVTDILKLLSSVVHLEGPPYGVNEKKMLPCPPGHGDAPAFGAVSDRLVEAVTSTHAGAGNGALPFHTLYRLCGRRLGEDLADRGRRAKALNEILASQIRDNAIAGELLNSSLYSMSHAEIERALAEGKGKLHNILALRHRCEKAVHSAVEVMNSVDEALYPAVTVKRKRSVKVRLEKQGGQKVLLTGSTLQEEKKR